MPPGGSVHGVRFRRSIDRWTPARIVRWAGETSPHTARLVTEILASKVHPQQGYRSCPGIMGLSKRYGPDRLEAACSLTLPTSPFEDRFSLLVDRQWVWKENRRLTRLLDQAKLKINACIEECGGNSARNAIANRSSLPHVRQRGEEVLAEKRNPRYQARRWVAEWTLSWLNRLRKLLVRYEKKTSTHEALLELASPSIVFRRVITIYG